MYFIYQEILKKLNKEEFSEHVESLKTKLTEKPKKLSTEFAAYWNEINNKEYDFDRCEFSIIYSVVMLSLNTKFKFKS